MNDPVKRPAHYTFGEIEVIDFIDQVVKHYPPELAYYVGNLFKYFARAPHKGKMMQDMQKGEWNATRAINKLAYLERAKQNDTNG